MNLKSVFQIILLFTIFTISGIFYYKFFATKDKKAELITENKEQLSIFEKQTCTSPLSD